MSTNDETPTTYDNNIEGTPLEVNTETVVDENPPVPAEAEPIPAGDDSDRPDPLEDADIDISNS